MFAQVQKDVEELSPEAVTSLKESLMNLLTRFAKGPPPVRTQICLAIAALAAHISANTWGDGGCVQWLVTRLNGSPPDVALPAMLEMLLVLPQVGTSQLGSARI